jgi:hypothetical protein
MHSFRIKKKFTLTLLTFLLVICAFNEVQGQTKTYLEGFKTGNIFQIPGLLGLGTGTSGLSAPMNSYGVGCLLGSSVTTPFRYYYLDNTNLIRTTTDKTTITASRNLGVLGALLNTGGDTYIQIRNTGNATILKGTPTYIKLKERPEISGLNLVVGGLLGLTELESIKGTGYIGATNYKFHDGGWGVLCSRAYNGSENNGSAIGTVAGTTTKIIINDLGEWYAKVTPDEDYNSVRLTVAFSPDLSLVNLAAEIKVNVYNAYTQELGTVCNPRPLFTDGGAATGISLNTQTIGLKLSDLIKNPERAINNNNTDYSSFSTGVAGVGVASTITQNFFFERKNTINDGVKFRLALPRSLINLSLFGNGITFLTYNGDELVNTQTLNDSVLDLNLLNLIDIGGGYSQFDVTINPNQQFTHIAVQFNSGLLGLNLLGDAFRIYDAILSPAKPTFTSPISSQNVSICSNTQAELSATTSSENELLWYTTPTGGTPVVKAYNEKYTTQTLSSDAIYYVASKKIGCPLESERVPVSVKVNALPSISLGSMPAICQEQVQTSIPYSAASGGILEYSITWDDLPNIGYQALPASPIPLTIPTIITTGIHNGSLTIKNENGCMNSYPINITVNQKPAAPHLIILNNSQY